MSYMEQQMDNKISSGISMCEKMTEEINDLQAENARLRAALEPFAKYADAYSEEASDYGLISLSTKDGKPIYITLANLREARSVLKGQSA